MIKPYNLAVYSNTNLRDNLIACPVCENENVHIEKPDYSTNDGRSSSITIPMWCEANHRWNLVFDYHKGDTKLVLKKVEEIVKDEEVTRLSYER